MKNKNNKYMKKHILISFLLLLSFNGNAQIFYQRIAVEENGVRKSDVSDKMFVSFGKNVCYESDKDGFIVEKNYREYNGENANVIDYYGNSFFGEGHWYFTKDYSKLHIRLDNGRTYIYEKKIAPSGFLASNRYSNTNQSNQYQINIIVPTTSFEVNNSPTNNSTIRRTCPSCNGTGKGLERIEYSPDYTGSGRYEWCSRCNRSMSPHTHIQQTCMTCYGKGYLEN